MFDSRLGTDPYGADPDEFESDVLRLVEQWWDDLNMEVEVGVDLSKCTVEVQSIERNGIGYMSDWDGRYTFDTVAEFREFVEQYAPEDYR